MKSMISNKITKMVHTDAHRRKKHQILAQQKKLNRKNRITNGHHSDKYCKNLYNTCGNGKKCMLEKGSFMFSYENVDLKCM